MSVLKFHESKIEDNVFHSRFAIGQRPLTKQALASLKQSVRQAQERIKKGSPSLDMRLCDHTDYKRIMHSAENSYTLADEWLVGRVKSLSVAAIESVDGLTWLNLQASLYDMRAGALAFRITDPSFAVCPMMPVRAEADPKNPKMRRPAEFGPIFAIDCIYAAPITSTQSALFSDGK